MTLEALASLTGLFGHGPPGLFLRGRHGVTHFRLQDPKSWDGTAPRKLAVCVHGIGTSMEVFHALVQPLLDEGFSVLRYDFFGCGWSVANDLYLHYTDNIFLDQLEDLLDHVLGKSTRKSLPVSLYVGHSTGGVVGILASAQSSREVNRLSLVSPALWAEKPLVARAADNVPRSVHWMISKGLLHSVVEDSYIKNVHNAFAWNATAQQYVYPAEYYMALAKNKAMFAAHPHVLPAIAGINCFFLSGHELGRHRQMLAEITTRTVKPARVQLIWGKLDIVVDYSHAEAAVAIAPDRISLYSLPGQGHEAFFEDTQPVADAIRLFLKE
eukprot:TRINITY_DN31540_c0_g1_i2.p1 TRINITY_DN31540_c0_g1~~TRINITY_DN31540_c0_g1_i2.p1  ORF type:complete len:374 (-),score=70.24 TRINITY_DN31540_c0_g1_i2:69-1046(-)